jgi:hypothetical protein
MKIKYLLIIALISFLLTGVILKISEKKEVYIQFVELLPENYLNYDFSDNDSTNVKLINYGFKDKGLESWKIEIDENRIKKVDQNYFKKKIVCSQYWFHFNFSMLNQKSKILKRFRIYIVYQNKNEIFILPVENVSTIFYD